MSTPIASAVVTDPTAPATVTDDPPARFRDLVAAEWIKTRTLRSTWCALALSAAAVVLASVMAARADFAFYADHGPDPHTPRMYALSDAFSQPGYLTLMLIAGSLGALAITAEYGKGSIRGTTIAVPARGQLVLAKAVVLAVVWTAAGLVLSIASFWVAQAILAGHDAGISITEPGALRALVASGLLAPIAALVGLAFGALIRSGSGSMVSTVFALLMLPTLFSRSHRWSADIMFATVSGAWDRLSRAWVPDARPDFFVASIRGSWTVYAAWPLVAVLVAVLVVRRRDV